MIRRSQPESPQEKSFRYLFKQSAHAALPLPASVAASRNAPLHSHSPAGVSAHCSRPAGWGLRGGVVVGPNPPACPLVALPLLGTVVDPREIETRVGIGRPGHRCCREQATDGQQGDSSPSPPAEATNTSGRRTRRSNRSGNQGDAALQRASGIVHGSPWKRLKTPPGAGWRNRIDTGGTAKGSWGGFFPPQ